MKRTLDNLQRSEIKWSLRAGMLCLIALFLWLGPLNAYRKMIKLDQQYMEAEHGVMAHINAGAFEQDTISPYATVNTVVYQASSDEVVISEALDQWLITDVHRPEHVLVIHDMGDEGWASVAANPELKQAMVMTAEQEAIAKKHGMQAVRMDELITEMLSDHVIDMFGE